MSDGRSRVRRHEPSAINDTNTSSSSAHEVQDEATRPLRRARLEPSNSPQHNDACLVASDPGDQGASLAAGVPGPAVEQHQHALDDPRLGPLLMVAAAASAAANTRPSDPLAAASVAQAAAGQVNAATAAHMLPGVSLSSSLPSAVAASAGTAVEDDDAAVAPMLVDRPHAARAAVRPHALQAPAQLPPLPAQPHPPAVDEGIAQAAIQAAAVLAASWAAAPAASAAAAAPGQRAVGLCHRHAVQLVREQLHAAAPDVRAQLLQRMVERRRQLLQQGQQQQGHQQQQQQHGHHHEQQGQQQQQQHGHQQQQLDMPQAASPPGTPSLRAVLEQAYHQEQLYAAADEHDEDSMPDESVMDLDRDERHAAALQLVAGRRHQLGRSSSTPSVMAAGWDAEAVVARTEQLEFYRKSRLHSIESELTSTPMPATGNA